MYLTIYHQDPLLNIEDEGSDRAVTSFPLEVFAMEVFYTEGYNPSR